VLRTRLRDRRHGGAGHVCHNRRRHGGNQPQARGSARQAAAGWSYAGQTGSRFAFSTRNLAQAQAHPRCP
jgi:hypothetical protein